MPCFDIEDDPDDDPDEDEDVDEEDEDDDEDDEDEDEDTETWQVSESILRDTIPLKAGSRLTSGTGLPRLARSFQPCQRLDRLSWPRVPTALLSLAGARNRLITLGITLRVRTEGFGYADRDNRTAPD